MAEHRRDGDGDDQPSEHGFKSRTVRGAARGATRLGERVHVDEVRRVPRGAHLDHV